MFEGTNGVYGEEIGNVTHVGGGSGWEEADRQLRRCARERARLDVEEAAWLIVAWRTRAHVHRGCATFNEYLERELGYTPRAADDRMKVAKALNAMPKLRAAMVDGRLPFTAVRELVRVIRKDTEREWVEAAAGKTVREIETMVSGRKPGDRPTDKPDPRLVEHGVHFKLRAEQLALYRQGRTALATKLGHGVDDADVLEAGMRALLAECAADGTKDDGSRSPYEISLTVCECCKRGWQEAGSQTVELTPEAVDTACCDANHLGRVDVAKPGRAKQDPPPRIRRAVMKRDRGRCCVPGCRSTRHLAVHHIVAREDGGDNSMENLCVLCWGHHNALHAGRLRIKGSAPDLTFEFEKPPLALDDKSRAVVQTLTRMGFDRATARGAVERAITHVGEAIDAESLLVTAIPYTKPTDLPPELVQDPVTLATGALVRLGFKRAEAYSAVLKARTHVGGSPSAEELVTAALRRMAPPRPPKAGA
jgi:hypothetical protein